MPSKKSEKFYCVKERKSFRTNSWKIIRFKNGKKAKKARCPKDSTPAYKFVGSEDNVRI